MASIFKKLAPVVFVVLALSVAMSLAEQTGGKSYTENEMESIKSVKGANQKASGGNKEQDFVWMFIDWDAFKSLKPALQPLHDMSKPVTELLSQQVLSLPMGDQLYNQIDSVGSQVSGALNPSRLPFVGSMIVGGSGSGASQTSSSSSTPSNSVGNAGSSGNPLETLMSQFTLGRR